jgi:hypothetical protein
MSKGKHMNDIRIENWGHLHDAIFEQAWNEPLKRFRSNFVFRGVCDLDYDLSTSLMRMGGPYDKLESVMLHNFRKYAYRSTVEQDSIWSWMATAQHHGLPTRLLDWTFSPYVALHFVTAEVDLYDRDGIIWCVNYLETNKLLPQKFKDRLSIYGDGVFSVETLAEVASTLQDFDQYAQKPFVVFLEPPSLDDRLVNQYALFSLVSGATNRLDEWLQDKPDLYRRIIIPAEMKWEIRDKLDHLNITERVLFPGLDGMSRWLKRYYSPRQE